MTSATLHIKLNPDFGTVEEKLWPEWPNSEAEEQFDTAIHYFYEYAKYEEEMTAEKNDMFVNEPVDGITDAATAILQEAAVDNLVAAVRALLRTDTVAGSLAARDKQAAEAGESEYTVLISRRNAFFGVGGDYSPHWVYVCPNCEVLRSGRHEFRLRRIMSADGTGSCPFQIEYDMFCEGGLCESKDGSVKLKIGSALIKLDGEDMAGQEVAQESYSQTVKDDTFDRRSLTSHMLEMEWEAVRWDKWQNNWSPLRRPSA